MIRHCSRWTRYNKKNHPTPQYRALRVARHPSSPLHHSRSPAFRALMTSSAASVKLDTGQRSHLCNGMRRLRICNNSAFPKPPLRVILTIQGPARYAAGILVHHDCLGVWDEKPRACPEQNFCTLTGRDCPASPFPNANPKLFAAENLNLQTAVGIVPSMKPCDRDRPAFQNPNPVFCIKTPML